MKYIITDQNEVCVGIDNKLHMELAEGFEGKVVSAGYCRKGEDGKYVVFGRSIGYHINSKPEDAVKLNQLMYG